MKTQVFNKLVRLIKTFRMGWLVPFLLFAKGEDRPAQLRAIFSGVGVPVLAVLTFLLVWSLSSSMIVTKFGTVPGPSQVVSAWNSLRNESRLEQIKEADHARRLREKRMDLVNTRAELLAQMPDGPIDFGDTDSNREAMDSAAAVFDEVNELLTVVNTVSMAADAETAGQLIDSLNNSSSRELAALVVSRLLPSEMDYKRAEKELRTGPRFNITESDSEEAKQGKRSAHKTAAKQLAAQKAGLMIERQKLTSLATKKALSILNQVPDSTQQVLDRLDRKAAEAGPRLDSWFEEILAAEAGGTKSPHKVKVKMLNKSFSTSPYPGKDTYLRQIATSLKTVFAGFLIASLVAVPIGILCGLNKTIHNAFNPLIQIFKPVSPLAWLPIVMIVVGALYSMDNPTFELSFVNSAITVALCSLWPTLVNTAIGVASTDQDFLNVAKVLKLSWFKRIYKVVLPASLPYVFTGLRLSLGVGWMVLIAAEMLAQNPGLGKFVWDMFQNGSSETLSMIMVAVFTIGIIGFILDTVMLSLQQLVSFGEREAI